MALDWGGTAYTDYGANKARRTGRVQDLIENDIVLCRTPFNINCPEYTTTNTSFQVAASRELFLPDHSVSRYLTGYVEIYGPPSGTGSWTIRIGATTGASVNFASPGAYALSAVAIVALPATPDTLITVELLVKSNTGGSVRLKSVDHLLFWFTD